MASISEQIITASALPSVVHAGGYPKGKDGSEGSEMSEASEGSEGNEHAPAELGMTSLTQAIHAGLNY